MNTESPRVALTTEGRHNGGWSAMHPQSTTPQLTTEQRFWQYVPEADYDECWLWTGALRRGYGRFYDGQHMVEAHRFSYELHFGPIPNGLCACHTCDVLYPVGDITNRRCVNPTHLFLGTKAENMADLAAKGRHQRRDMSKVAKLTEGQVRTIRATPRGNGVSDILAARYGVSRNTIRSVWARQSWRHLTD